MKYYRSLITGKIFLDNSFRYLNDIYGDGHLENEVFGKVVEEIDPPIISDCIKSGSIFAAVYRYKELHPECSIKEAKRVVDLIRKDMSNGFKKKKFKKKKPEKVEGIPENPGE